MGEAWRRTMPWLVACVIACHAVNYALGRAFGYSGWPVTKFLPSQIAEVVLWDAAIVVGLAWWLGRAQRKRAMQPEPPPPAGFEVTPIART